MLSNENLKKFMKHGRVKAIALHCIVIELTAIQCSKNMHRRPLSYRMYIHTSCNGEDAKFDDLVLFLPLPVSPSTNSANIFPAQPADGSWPTSWGNLLRCRKKCKLKKIARKTTTGTKLMFDV